MFLTGKYSVEEEDFVYKKKYVAVIPHSIRKHFRVISSMFPSLFFRPPRVKENTIFDIAKRPLPVNVFCYNEDRKSFVYRLRNPLRKTLSLPLNKRAKVVEGRIRIERELLNKFKRLLKSRMWDLSMFYARFVDDAGHLVCRRISDSLKYHLIADKWAREVKEILTSRDLMLIVSDHGILYGKHTPYAFYSLSKPIKLDIKSICDFYKVISALLNQ